jgi:2-oxoisovalerate dehydrogenase E1 component alpha subunit
MDGTENGALVNAPRLSFHVPEPKFRPGDEADYSHLNIPNAGEQPRPDEACPAAHTFGLTDGLVRVLSDDDRAIGPWNPQLSPESLRRILRDMSLTRAFDDRMFRSQRQGKSSFYIKCTGEEATSVASAYALAADDMVFPSYRQQGILIARGFPIVEMANQIYANRRDRLKGRQLPVLYSAREYNFFSISGNVATQFPTAVGWAMASAIKNDSRIAAAWIGEGSSAEGDFHAALTFAAVYNAPVVFNIINNQWAISSFSGLAGAERATFAARAIGFGIAGLRVDGNDPLAVFAAVKWAANRARANAGPTLIEHFTYRAEGHSTSDDPGAYRSAQERAKWPLGDPLVRLKRHLIALGEWSEDRHATMEAHLAERVRSATKEAEENGVLGNGLRHPVATMFEEVFESLPWHLHEQAQRAIREMRPTEGMG